MPCCVQPQLLHRFIDAVLLDEPRLVAMFQEKGPVLEGTMSEDWTLRRPQIRTCRTKKSFLYSSYFCSIIASAFTCSPVASSFALSYQTDRSQLPWDDRRSPLTSSACAVLYHSVKSRRETLSSSSSGGGTPLETPGPIPSPPSPSPGRPPSLREGYGYLASGGGPYESYPRRGDIDRLAPEAGA